MYDHKQLTDVEWKSYTNSKILFLVMRTQSGVFESTQRTNLLPWGAVVDGIIKCVSLIIFFCVDLNNKLHAKIIHLAAAVPFQKHFIEEIMIPEPFQ